MTCLSPARISMAVLKFPMFQHDMAIRRMHERMALRSSCVGWEIMIWVTQELTYSGEKKMERQMRETLLLCPVMCHIAYIGLRKLLSAATLVLLLTSHVSSKQNNFRCNNERTEAYASEGCMTD